MPTNSKSNATKTQNEKVNTTANDNKKIADLEKKIEELTKLLQEKDTIIEDKNKENKKESIEDSEILEEPNPNKQIRLMSLYYGKLNLSTEPFGRGRIISFSKYGEIKNVLYSTLIDIVNNNRKFSEKGYYYILDNNAVYHLGLSEYYDNIILNKEIIDNICNYSDEEIEDILKNANAEQIDVLVHNLATKIYNNKPVDLNKCDTISRICKIDIMSKVSEMRELENNMKNKK